MTSASVRLSGQPVGTLMVEGDGRLRFRYLEDWIRSGGQPLSLSMPVRAEEYDHAGAGPFFDGLLPEHPAARAALGRYLQVSASDDFSLLYALGRECPGAVSIVPEDDPVVAEGSVRPTYRLLSEQELGDLLRRLPQRPLFVDADGEVRLSLAGVHHKAAVIATSKGVALATGHTATTHIIKVDIVGLEDSIKVEHFCMLAAKEAGLDVASTSIRTADGIAYMLVARYDRAVVAGHEFNYVRRIHQEDFCQALGRFPREKYEKDGGPGWKACFDLTAHLRDPVAGRTELLGRAIFQFLIGNPDAHAKNYSLVYRRPRELELSKLYDVNNAAAYRSHYKEQRPRLAMFVGGERDPDKLTLADWETFGREVGLSVEIVRTRLVEMARALLLHVPRLRQDLAGSVADTPLLDIACADIVERCRRVVG